MLATIKILNVSLTTWMQRASASTKREAKFLGKMMSPGKKKRFYNNNEFPSVLKITSPVGQPGKSAKKRMSVLNKLFMKYITDLMANGSSVSDEIYGKGIEVSKVEVTSAFNLVNVFWLTKSDKSDAEVAVSLRRIAGILQHELSQLKIVGVIPTISFVKDEELARQRKVDHLLSIADYGDEYEPTQIGAIMRTELTSVAKIPMSIQEQIKALEKTEKFDNEPLPEMTNYIYGLDHAKIMGRILADINISKQAWAKEADPDSVMTADSAAKPEKIREIDKNIYDDKYSRRASNNLAAFLRKRQIMQNELKNQATVANSYVKLVAESWADRDVEESIQDEGEEEYDYFDTMMRNFDVHEEDWDRDETDSRYE